MYRISSTSSFHNGRQFDSLAEAVSAADRLASKGETADVIRDVDRDRFHVVYTPADCQSGQATRGTYTR